MTTPKTLRRLSLAAAFAAAATLLLSASASAATPSPGWTISSVAEPTNFTSAHNGACEEKPNFVYPSRISNPCDSYKIVARNVGSLPTTEPLTIADALPPGVQAVYAVLQVNRPETVSAFSECSIAPVRCEYTGSVPPDGVLILTVNVLVSPSAGPTLLNSATLEGGNLSQPLSTSVPATEPNGVGEATPPFALGGFDMLVAGADGAPDPLAGDHPFGITTSFAIPTVTRHNESTSKDLHFPVGRIKNLLVDLPPGFVGDPQATPRCTLSALTENFNNSAATTNCPRASRIGTITFEGEGYYRTSGGAFLLASGIFNMAPEPGVPAEFGVSYLGKPVLMKASVLPSASGYRLRVSVPGLIAVPLSSISLTFFGNPALRTGGATESSAFLTNPMNCGSGPQKARIEANTWEEPDSWVSSESNVYPRVKGCDLLSFEPTLTLTPEVHSADTPSGYEVDLHVPQARNVYPFLATPELKDAHVTLPQGLAVSPSAAGGLAGCAETGPEGIQLGNHNTLGHEVQEGEEAGPGGLPRASRGHCPAASQVGTVEVTTPLLPDPLHGRVYVGAPDCSPCSDSDAAAGKMLKLYIEAEGSGVVVKLPGRVSADPATGRLSATFLENPQLPFEDLKLHFNSGPRAPLANPRTCATYTTTSDLTPWSAPETPDASPSSSFAVDAGANGQPCASSEAQLPNKPAFSAGTTSPIAGAYSPFVLKLSREDGSQQLRSVDTTLPPGLTGRLAGLGECPDAQIAAAANQSGAGERANPSCPAGSEVGIVNVGAGPGASPFYVQGRAYLAGPYKGAPLSLAIITPALAGPFDLGTVVVRTALYVDPETAQIHAVSDPIPTIRSGIPLDVRSVALNMSRPSFTLNPTSCDPMSVLGAATSTLGNVAALSSPFQVGACNALAFKPKLALSLKGPTKRAKHPALKATLTMPPGGANIARAQVTLPHSEFLDQAHIGTVCTRVQFNAGAGNGAECPPASIYGHARAITPLLDNPIEGNVFLRSSFHKLPDLVAALNGQISVDLAGKVDTGRGGGIRNTFEVVPDAPVTKFTLKMKGGSKGLLVNSENICRKPQKALAHFVAQNGKVSDTTPLIANDCKPRKGKKKGRSHR